jgi:hypothetical protein
LKIEIGKYKTDPNNDFWGKTWQLFSRRSWEAPQSFIGREYSQARNLFGKVDRVDYFGGATFVTNENAGKRNGVSLGNYINININDEITGDFEQKVLSDLLFMHEYGHTFDSRIYGLTYLLSIGIPSLNSASKNEAITAPPFDTHGSYWTERRANRHTKKYFEKYYGMNWSAIYGYYLKWDEELKTYILTPYTIEDIYPTY